MDERGFEEALERADGAIAEGKSLDGTGFWKAVGLLRVRPDLAAKHAERVAAIDRVAFEQGVKLKVPAPLGTLVLSAGTLIGLAAVVVAPKFTSLIRDLAVLAGAGILLVSTHSLAHVIVGRLFGIRFTHYFLGGPPPPRPGAKIDYATYLLIPPKRRAWMHASGAIVTKLVPFALIPAGLAAGVSVWVLLVLALIGLGQIGTDLAFSTKTSDWKRFRREWRAAKSPTGTSTTPSR